MTPSPTSDEEKIILILDDYQQELWDKFKEKIAISNYEWRSPELWNKYATIIAEKILRAERRRIAEAVIKVINDDDYLLYGVSWFQPHYSDNSTSIKFQKNLIESVKKLLEE